MKDHANLLDGARTVRYYYADGTCLCPRCQHPYSEHHRMPGPLKLRQLCDGTLVKLWAT